MSYPFEYSSTIGQPVAMAYDISHPKAPHALYAAAVVAILYHQDMLTPAGHEAMEAELGAEVHQKKMVYEGLAHVAIVVLAWRYLSKRSVPLSNKLVAGAGAAALHLLAVPKVGKLALPEEESA